MKAWWDERSQRERILLGVMAGIFAFLILGPGVLGPIVSSRAAAEQDYRAALADLAVMQEGARRMAALRVAEPGAPGGAATGVVAEPGQETLRSVIGNEAERAGLRYDALNADEREQEAAVTFASVNPPELFAWLQDLQRRHRITVVSATISRPEIDEGGVRATVRLMRAVL